VILVRGRIDVPGAGLATADAAAPVGNQLTTAGGDVSHRRGTAETEIVPASAVRCSRISVSGLASTLCTRCPGSP